MILSSSLRVTCFSQTSNSQFIYLYEQKEKGSFQHSSFLAGGATIAAGRLIAKAGILKVLVSKLCPADYLKFIFNINAFVYINDATVNI